MMRFLAERIKPAHGYSQWLHIALVMIMPIALLVLVRLQGAFVQLALSLVLLSKWRMLAVRPRFWVTNVRANAVDITIGLSSVIFMAASPNGYVQIFWTTLYGLWLLAIKPSNNMLLVAGQAMLAQLCGLTILFLLWANGPLLGLVGLSGIICYISARHFFDNFDEPYGRLLSYLWAYFGAALVWVMGHWLLFYGVIAQPTLILSIIGYGFVVLYYFDHKDTLSTEIRQYALYTMVAATVLVVIATWVLGGWGNKVV
jgi:hypothetical protein